MEQHSGRSLDVRLSEAESVLRASENNTPSKGERRLNKFGDVFGNVTDTYSNVAQSDAASATFSIVKDQISSFTDNSKILMSVLDEVAKAHPFIQVAVSLFKAAVMLEIRRRENDDKVLALNLAMYDMMSVMRLLQQITNARHQGPDGQTVEDRLRRRMVDIIESIKRCAKLCDSYQKRRTAVKILTSFKWEGKFTDLALQFSEHKAGLQFDLQIHASLQLSAANVTLATVNDNVAIIMKMVFTLMRTPEERELMAFITSKGGADKVVKDDALLNALLSKQKVEKGRGDSRAKLGRAEPTLTVKDLREEINKDVEQVLEGNAKTFAEKFEAQRLQIEEVKVTIRHESDRVIDAVLAGPHERIKDQDLYHIWKEMGWKGSVKARHFVMALHDYFTERKQHAVNDQDHALTQIRQIARDTTSADTKVQEITQVAQQAPDMAVDDLWALEYVNVFRVQPLIEALDDDVSSFVTVAEVNIFTAARPLGWRGVTLPFALLRWIAYWTIGFEFSINWYYRRIIRLIDEVSKQSKKVLPLNRKIVNDFIQSHSVSFIDDLCNGLQSATAFDGVDWDNNPLFDRFKSYILEEEQRMEKMLRTVTYNLDDENMLTLVTGGGRPEKYIMPLVYLLLRRALHVIEIAAHTTLNRDELSIVQDSLATARSAVWSRIGTLRAVCQLQNLNPDEQLKKFFSGMYCYMWTDNVMGDYWTRSIENGLDGEENVLIDGGADSVSVSVDKADALPSAGNHAPPSEAHPNNDSQSPSAPFTPHPNVGLFFGGHEQYDLDFNALTPSDLVAVEGDSLVGHWIGMYMSDLTGDTAGLAAFDITVHNDDGTFSGEGVDLSGKCAVKGELKDLRVVFTKTYAPQGNGSDTIWQHQCLLDKEQDEVRGRWGHPTNDEDIQSYLGGTEDAVGDTLGKFSFQRRPVEYFLFRPDKDFAENRIRALWTWAIRSVLRMVQSKHLQWKVIRDHRDRRRRYLELTQQRHSDAEAVEWAELVRTITPETLRFWESLRVFRERRTIAHNVYCDGCSGDVIGSRFTCVQCSQGEIWHTVDLCARCMGKSVYRASDKKRHTPGHNLLQIRDVIHKRAVLAAHSAVEAALQHATALVDHVKDEKVPLWPIIWDSPICVICNKTVTRPFWFCIECEDGIFVCYDCNARTIVEQPWLFERRAHTDPSIHSWAHTLVLAPLPEDSATSQADTPSIDNRLAQLSTGVEVNTTEINRLHARLDTMSQHMERLEMLLSRLVDSEGNQ
ncbi:hypothetical protein BDZ89DRAFT_1059909 [Hymenopellis radicata]|nr:hypothetical protein BDZ89DRAFT_1059909 [Hymenopellis radicata]